MNSCRVLIVEDEAIVAMDVEERLAAMGYQLAGRATSGEQALALAEELHPDLILMDVRLQGTMNGIDAAEHVRRRFHVPVIFLTAYSEDATLERAKVAEPFGYILKPFDDRELKSTIEIALYKHRAEEEIRGLNRLYNVLSQVNQAIVRIPARQELLNTVCRLVVEHGSVDLAWIGWHNPATSQIKPVAQFGNQCEFLSQVDFYVEDRPEGQGNPGDAIREGRPFVCNESGSNPCLQVPAQTPAGCGFQSSASFPLRFQGELCGALTLCVAEPGFFRAREIELLEEVAMDISFALDKIENDTRRKHTEAALVAERTHLRTLVNTIPDMVWLKDPRGAYLAGNPAFERFMGVKEAELLGKTDYDFFPQELAEFFRGHDRNAVLAGKPTVNTEWVTIADDGSRVLLDTIKTPMLDDRGQLVGVLGIARDITTTWRAEEALRTSEQRFRDISEASGEFLWELDLAGCVTYISKRVESILGYRPDEVLGRRPFEFMEEAEASRTEALWREKAQLKMGFRESEHRVVSRSARPVWLAITAVPVLGPTGRLLGFRGAALDITERRQAEERLREYEKVVEGLEEMIAVVDQDYRYLIANRAFLNYRDLERGQVIGRLVEDILGKEVFGKDIKKKLDECFHGNVVRYEMKYNYHKFGEKDLFITYLPIEGPAGVDRVACVLQDITERKQAEEERTHMEAQLRQAQKMEALGTLAGGIAHDFNNILGIIVGYSEMADMDAVEEGRVRSNIREVLKAAGRAKDLVQQILAFSRLSGQEKKPVQVGLIVKEALKMLRSSLPSTIEIQMNVASKSVVSADPTQIHQVLMNLCTNAAHAMQAEGGVLGVNLTDVLLEQESSLLHPHLQAGPYVELTIKDTGHGMEPPILDRIFDPFFTTKEQGVGTGLGLSVVHGIVKSHGGAIQVESLPGKGTTFQVFLPAMETAPEPHAVEVAPLPRGQERVLLVDDEPALTLVIKQMLEHLGYEVDYRTNGLEALDAFCHRSKEKPFDLVITDMTMPHLAGIDLAKELFKLRPDLPILLCTGFSEKVDAEKARSLGIRGFLMKPVVLRELAEMIRKALDERK